MFKEPRDTPSFSWSQLGDIEKGRPNLGPQTSVAMYRLMQFTLRDAIIQHSGPEAAREIFYNAGFVSGKEMYDNLIGEVHEPTELVAKLQQVAKSLAIGIVRFEEVNLDAMTFVLTVEEDLDCSGLPVCEETVCTWDEGLIAGILFGFSGKHFKVCEVDCWCTGARICRFRAELAA